MLSIPFYGNFIADNYITYAFTDAEEYRRMLDNGEIPYGDVNADFTVSLKAFNDDVAMSIPQHMTCNPKVAHIAEIITKTCAKENEEHQMFFDYQTCVLILDELFCQDHKIK